ncbi:uncharacterized protein LOC141684428 [Apium graveolens]|uniref:uncharacterized protein LOC141684428 n=1 Tax=Apium graveolens TaxID=4045 RepID=UPI003D78D246
MRFNIMDNVIMLENRIEEEEFEEESDNQFYETVKYLLMVINAIMTVLKANLTIMNEPIGRSLTRRPISRLGYFFINNLMKEDPENFRELHRMYPNVFLKLCGIIREGTNLEDTRYVSIEEMVAMFLLIIGHNDRYCNVRQRFGRSHFTASRNLNKDCVGGIDGTHIPAMIRGRDVSSYHNCHRFNSQNVLSGWKGSAHDSKLLNDDGLEVPQGKYYLFDCRFANRRQFLSAIRKVRYYLKEFGGEGRHTRNANELFNLHHSSLRNVIERIFGIFKSRFTIFKIAPPFSFQVQAELVLACAGLHNFLRKECRSDEYPIEVVDDQSSDMEEADNPESNIPSQQQQRTEANTWRANIANSKWEDRPRNAVNEEYEEDQYDES